MNKKKIDVKAEVIESDIYFRYRKAQNRVLDTERLGQLHVSDLNSPCVRKVYYSKNTPKREMDTESSKALIFGQMVHKAIILEPDANEVTLGYDWVKNESVDLKELSKKLDPSDPRWYDIIIGTIDDLVMVGMDTVICDKKTTGSIDYFKKYKKPSESHVSQINKYAVLLKKCRGVTATKGCVVYISSTMTKDPYDKPTILSFDLEEQEDTYKEMVEKAKAIKNAMVNDEKPERTKCFLCDGMCPHATFCFDDD
jgi:CRISPR/Cas system-associated exonuclease Cas4 (RecB family)